MPAQIGLKLRESVKAHGVSKAADIFREALAAKKFSREDISLREMAENMIGSNWADTLKNYAGRLRESVEAVDSSGFSAITGQLLIDTIREKYKLATFITDEMFTVAKISNGNLGTQIEPYLSDVTDDPGVVNQGQPYPATAFTGQYVTYPAPEKYGRICRVTFEMIYSDLTGQVLDSAASVGTRVGLWVEEKRLRVAFGLTNPFNWNGTAYNTYLTTGSWINKLTDFTLTNWTSVNRIEQLFAKMTDPVTGKPIDLDANGMVVMPTLKYTAKRILNATEVRSGDVTSGTGDQVISANPLDTNYKLMTSKHARAQVVGFGAVTEAITDTYVLTGDFKKGLLWREVFPMQTVQAPPQSQEEFNQDVVLQVKGNVYGVAAVREPRALVLAYNASA